MWVRSLKIRFILAGCVLVAATVGSSVWSAVTFYRLTGVVDETLRESQETIDLSAALAGSLEREDDALLLFLSGEIEAARRDLAEERQRGDEGFERLLSRLHNGVEEEQRLAVTLRQHIDAYRAAGDNLLIHNNRMDGLDRYHNHVNPLLRQAVGGFEQLREANFRSMQKAGIRARDEAVRGIRVVVIISLLAVLAGVAVAAWLARSVLGPIRELTASVEDIRQGHFDRRVRQTTIDELGHLAAGFNRMAESLAEYRRSSLGELVTAKMTLEATLNALPDAVLVFGPDRTLVARNPPAEALLKATRASTATCLDDLPFSDQYRAAIADALAGKTPVTRSPDFRDTFDVFINEQLRRFLLTAVPIPDFTPGRFGAVAVLDDVTEFARLDELRSELIGVASHELKSPLTSLRMNLLMLGETTSAMTSRQQELVAAAVRGCEELGLTIEELLDVTRIEAEQLRLNLIPIDVGAVLAATRQALQIRYDDAEVRLVVKSSATPALVRGDPARLGSVFANVLTNALKYSPTGGVVTVQVMSGENTRIGDKNTVQIAVTDQGPGVPAEFRTRVFEKFFRVEHQPGYRLENVRGTGIGLYLCREIIRAHHGTIVCEPGDDGIGTRIVIALPADI
jgi:NtrC-family two-component system sensor histidine kinase KinB